MKEETNKNQISEKVLDKIKSENIKPRSRFYFAVRNFGIWTLVTFTILLGSLSVSSLIFRIVNINIICPSNLNIKCLDSFEDFLSVLPSLWVICLGFLGYLAYKEIRFTDKGYRYKLSTLILSLILASCILGTVFYEFGSGYLLDDFASRHVPFHRGMEMIQREKLMNPEMGILIGRVISVSDDGLILNDPARILWSVSFDDYLEDEDKEFIEEGLRVGIKGELTSEEENTFRAIIIKPLNFRGQPIHPMSLGY